MTPKVFDCFLFYRELDLLEIRLGALSPRVDRFVLAEATRDFAGQPKPLYFQDNRDRFKPWLDRIEHVVIDTDPPDPDVRWARQRYQRDQFLHGLAAAAPDDIVFVSDLDEIPAPWALDKAISLLTASPCAVVMTMRGHHHRVDLRGRDRALATTRAVRCRHFGTPHLVRQFKRAYWKSAPAWADQIPFGYHSTIASGRPLRRHVIEDAGWHMTSIGVADFTRAKMTAFAPDEQLPPDHPATRQAELIDAGDADTLAQFDQVPLEDLPKPLRDNPARFAHLFAYPPVADASESHRTPA